MTSVVVPTLNAGSTLEACLKSIRDQSSKVHEIIVVDAMSSDNTVEIASRLADRIIISQPNRSAQRNLGCEVATGLLILFIDADMVLSPNVVSDCEAAFMDDPSVVGMVIPEESFGTTFWAHVKGLERGFYQGVWWMEAARCFKREAIMSIGGYDPELIGGEDWDVDERARKYGLVARVSAVIWHNEQNLSLRRILDKKGHYASTLDLYWAKHPGRARRQLSLGSRVRLMVTNPFPLIRHPILSIGLVIVGIAEWIARLLESNSALDAPIELAGVSDKGETRGRRR